MQYPFSIPKRENSPANLLPSSMGEPYIFDYTDPIFSELPIRDVNYMQEWTMNILENTGKKWGIAGYLEDRSLRLKGTHLIDEGRVYHLGIDIIAKDGTPIHASFDGEVIESATEEGKASYGGYIITRYTMNNHSVMVLYGHLDPMSLKPTGLIHAGDRIGVIGSPEVNGDWTTHLHMQAFTGKDFEKWKHKGYCTLSDIPTIHQYCPDPSFLLHY